MNIFFVCFVLVLWCLASFIHRPLVFTLAWHESKNIDFFVYHRILVSMGCSLEQIPFLARFLAKKKEQCTFYL